MKAFFTNPKFVAALSRFAKFIAFTGVFAASGAVVLALKQDPTPTSTFLADAAVTGFATGVIAACEKYLTWFEDPTLPDPTATPPAPAPTAPTALPTPPEK